MEKKRISDFSAEELEVFLDFAKQYNTVAGIKSNLLGLIYEKANGIEKEWPTLEEKEKKKWDQRYLPYHMYPQDGRLLEEFNINSLDELADANLDEIMDIISETIIDFKYFPDRKAETKERFESIVKEYKKEKNDIDGKAK